MSKPKFDPSKPFAVAAKPKFDPSQPFDEQPDLSAPAIDRGVGDALVRGVAQGGSLGFADELTAGVGAVKDWGAGKLGLRGDIDLGDAYDSYIDQVRDADNAAREGHPVAFTAGEVGGGVASAVVPGMAALNPMKAGSALGRMGIAAGNGAVSGLGHSEAEDLGGLATDVGLGAAGGAAGQGLLDKAAPVAGAALKKGVELVGKAGEKAKEVAERLAFKAAAGGQSKAYDEAVRKGTMNQIGRDMLDDGVVKFGSNARKISERADDARKVVGQQMDTLFDEIDRSGQAAVDGKAIAAGIRKYSEQIKSPANQSTVEKLLAQADEFEQMGAIPLKEAQRLKNTYKYDARDPAAMPIGKEAANQIKRTIGGEMDSAVASYASQAEQRAAQAAQPQSQFGEALQTGSGRSVRAPAPPEGLTPVLKTAEAASTPESSKAAQIYDALKQKYGSMATGANAAETLANRQEKNRLFSLTDYIAGGIGGGITANPATAIATASANKVLRERGVASSAVGLDKIGSMLQQAPEAFGQFAPQLQAAARRGNQALGVTHFLLMQRDLEYQKLIGGKGD